MNLVHRIVELHRTLTSAGVPHAFGGALALAWCTERARATIDIDINLFIEIDQADAVFAALPGGVDVTDANRAEIVKSGQTRLWWDQTPVDVFFNTTPFHQQVATRARFEHFGGQNIPFVSCSDLAVFKAFFDRTKDWADLEEMAGARTLDRQFVLGVLTDYLGGSDHRIERLRTL